MNQANLFLLGETNYKRISSMVGPCYYPAGHLFHYLGIVKILRMTDYGEHILQLLHVLASTIILYYTMQLVHFYH